MQYQVRDDGGLDQGGGSEGGDEWSNSGCTFQRAQGFADELDGGCERKSGVSMRPRDLA